MGRFLRERQPSSERLGGAKEIFGRGRTHTTRIPTCARGFGKRDARMLGTQTQPQRAQITFFPTHCDRTHPTRQSATEKMSRSAGSGLQCGHCAARCPPQHPSHPPPASGATDLSACRVRRCACLATKQAHCVIAHVVVQALAAVGNAGAWLRHEMRAASTPGCRRRVGAHAGGGDTDGQN